MSADERARLFVALSLPASVRSALASWAAGAVEGVPGVRLLRGEDLHVTLCFLGWRLASEAPAVLAACEVVAGRPRARLRVEEAIWLPPRRPRVLAVRLDDASGALAQAQAALSEALAAGGWYAPEKRPFLAHVTVARGAGARVSEVARRGGRGLRPPPSLAFEGSRITLFRSRLSAAGARYEPLGEVLLS